MISQGAYHAPAYRTPHFKVRSGRERIPCVQPACKDRAGELT
jgi:hypothetical protein